MKDKLKYILLLLTICVLNGTFAQNNPFCTVGCAEGEVIHVNLNNYLDGLPNNHVEAQWWATADRQSGTQLLTSIAKEPGDYYAFYYDVINDCHNQEVSTAFIRVEGCAVLKLWKTGVYVDKNTDDIVNVGDEIIYTFTVENKGNLAIHDIAVSDSLLGGNFPIYVSGDLNNNDSLDVAETWTYTAIYQITQADIDKGGVYNFAMANGKNPQGNPIDEVESEDPTPLDSNDPNYDPNCPTCTFTEFTTEPSLEITKSGSYNAETGLITYTFTVENTGNVTLTDVVVNDSLLINQPIYVSGDGNDNDYLDVTEVWIYTAIYNITQVDIDAGGVWNIAEVTGNDPDGNPVTGTSTDPNPIAPSNPNYDPNCPTCTFTSLDQEPLIILWKSGEYVDANNDGKLNIGDVIEYTFKVENIGNTTIHDIVVTDPLVEVNGNPITLVPRAVDSTTFIATYYLTQEDINALVVYNLATAEGTTGSGEVVKTNSKDSNPLEEGHPLYNSSCPDCTVTLLPEGEFEELKVPNGFTPDWDGFNDTWVIKGIEFFPDNHLVVFNRWGSIVYEASGYLNEWDGTSNNKLNVGGTELPTGTYYYVLDTKNDSIGVVKGFVYLQR